MKHLRKDDGYVLVYVLIVFTILALVAGSICAMALNNLKAQKADVARMEARYAAEGELQKFVAEVGALKVSTEEPYYDDSAAATSAATGLFYAAVAAFDHAPDAETGFDDLDVAVDVGQSQVTVTIRFKTQSIQTEITAVSKLILDSGYQKKSGEGEPDAYQGTCSLAENGWQYTSYDISYKEVPQ